MSADSLTKYSTSSSPHLFVIWASRAFSDEKASSRSNSSSCGLGSSLKIQNAEIMRNPYLTNLQMRTKVPESGRENRRLQWGQGGFELRCDQSELLVLDSKEFVGPDGCKDQGRVTNSISLPFLLFTIKNRKNYFLRFARVM